MRLPRTIPLRWRFVLVVLFGAVLPLGLVGLWLTRSAERSGEDLLRGRLQETLASIVSEMGRRWIGVRSDLLEIAEHPVVQGDLRAGEGGAIADNREEQLRSVYTTYQRDLAQVTVRDVNGAARFRLMPDPGLADFADRIVTAVLPVELAIYQPLSGERLGTLEADVRMSSLLSSGAEWAGVGGVLAAFDRATGSSLLPLSFDPDLFRQRRFEWAGEPWVSTSQTLSEPPVELVLAAPVGPFEQPFAQATRRGTLALILVAVVSFALVTVVTAGITRALGRLAVAADAVSEGHLDRKVPERGGDELQRVARAFNTMTENLRRTLEELSRQQSLAAVGEFAAQLAHEVRNPLSSIRIDLQRAEEKLATPGERELVGRALRSVERLEATVTGALRVARSGRVSRQPLDLRPVLEAAMRGAEPEFKNNGVRLEPLGDRAEHISVSGDAAALEQVFLNLLLNAAQAHENGGRAGVTIETGDRAVEVLVWDDGIGIPSEIRDQMFDPFYSTKDEGTGLGLAIAQRIVVAHSGDLVVDSAPGKGTTVRVRLPLAERSGA